MQNIQFVEYFLTKRSLNEIPIGSNVKLSRPVAAIFDFRSAQK